MNIKTKVKIAGATLIAVLLLLVATTHFALQKLKVRGPVYDQIIETKALTIDMLPAPLNMRGAYLNAVMMVFEPAKRDEFSAGLAADRKRFLDRKDYWRKQKLDDKLRAALETSIQHSEKFFDALDRDFLPAIARQDTTTAKDALDRLTPLYEQARSTTVAAAAEVGAVATQIERQSETSEKTWTAATITVSIVMIMLAIAGAVALMRSVLAPLDDLQKFMIKLSGGETNFTITGLERRDEIGAMAQSIETFRLAAIEKQRLETEQVAQRAKDRARQEFLEQQVQNFRGELSQAIGSLGSETNSITKAAKLMVSVSDTTTNDAKAAEEATSGAAANAQAVAAATEQLGASIREIAGQAHRASDIVTQTTEAARRANSDVEGLADAAQKIGSIVEIIKNVAEQTNLLALNATIEAARAGEAGKGFAVVATEVKNLAAQTAKATNEISSQILNVQTSTSTTVESIRAIATRIDEINGLTGSIAAAVEQQEAATREIAQNVTSAADRSRNAATNVTSVLSAADQARSEAQTMRHTSEELSRVASRIGGSFEKFVSAVTSNAEARRFDERSGAGGMRAAA